MKYEKPIFNSLEDWEKGSGICQNGSINITDACNTGTLADGFKADCTVGVQATWYCQNGTVAAKKCRAGSAP